MNNETNLQEKKIEIEERLASYQKRLSQVEKIYNDVANGFSDQISKLNYECDRVISNSIAGIKECANVSALNDAVSTMKEKWASSDKCLGETQEQLSSEKSRLIKIIDELKEERDWISVKISS